MNTPEQMVDLLFGDRGPLDGLDRDMLLIQALDPDAHLRFSEGAWYVRAAIDITDGEIISSATEHRGSPWEALQAYRIRLQELEPGQRVVTNALRPNRREWRWNGAAWAEVER